MRVHLKRMSGDKGEIHIGGKKVADVVSWKLETPISIDSQFDILLSQIDAQLFTGLAYLKWRIRNEDAFNRFLTEVICQTQALLPKLNP